MKQTGLKWRKASLLMCIALASAVPGLAQAQHRGHRGGSFGFYFGGPGPFYYPPAYYPPSFYPYHYAYPPVVVQQQAPVYIEQTAPEAAPAPAAPAAQAGNYWYYCSNPQGYYPYVQHCPQAWQKVSPVPAGQQ